LGLDARRRLAWLVTVDGRQPGFSEGANLDELTDILISLGARDAINLDGGLGLLLLENGTWGMHLGQLFCPAHAGP
jgi:exopolysaccharide biosynthesis protein